MLARRSTIALLLGAVIVAGCSEPADDRWYTEEQVQVGEAVFEAECAVCHGEQAQGAENWQQRDDDGYFPPPPLNGTAHAWHHPKDELRTFIRDGFNRMPGFGDRLDDNEIDAAIAWFQSHWSDDVYEAWLDYDERGESGHDAGADTQGDDPGVE
ncbi:c-type cytochrome [Aquisalimonas asiatica]|uniref:Cytochrome C oxidase, cbb3-type, subunit III n=1 Tax=Aquisalimonas asiatica TaxID=406100 RepID=A0A1H8V8X5_9GAMM|nr:cytochrome c [Aquisalimonas asiatica]SEP11727.1 Cytochrome C oxidase, cbb3-type, subunit III [Aquisalimonas asiatica]